MLVSPLLRANSAKHVARLSTSAQVQKALPLFLPTHQQVHDGGLSPTLSMIMFGKPGAGKGTLSGRLVKKYDILALSTGDLLRTHIEERTEVGRQAEQIVAEGGLLPDDIMLKVVTSKLESLHNMHWILDGFPRTIGQAKLLDAHLKKRKTPLSLIVNVDVPDNIILSRISDRWVHIPSGRVYNMSYNRPLVEGFDDHTGEPLTKRPDDNPEIFARRLKQFYESTSPLLEYYGSAQAPTSYSTTIHGKTSDEIWPHLDELVQTMFPTLRPRPESAADRRQHSLSDATALASTHLSSASVAAVNGVYGRDEN